MILDVLHNSHPIEMPIKKPTEINEIFDKIRLGSSMIGLVRTRIGEEAIGVHHFHCFILTIKSLTARVQGETFPPQNRFGIQTVVYALARSGHIKYVDYSKLLRRVVLEYNEHNINEFL
jgi:hypothetical protein